MSKLVYILSALLLLISDGFGSETYKRIVDISVQIDSSAGKKVFMLSWNNDDDKAQSFYISRKLKNDEIWTVLDTIAYPANQYIDSTVNGDINALEYQIIKTTIDTSYSGYGYIYAGYDLMMPSYRGIALLVVDETLQKSLNSEIEQYKKDLIGDGYNVIVRYVERAEKFYAPAVSRTKQIIDKVLTEHPNDTFTIILFGRVPVPYSGNTAWDGHQPDHTGAWPADLYYATDREQWTDENVFNNAPARRENKNIPFDGKFDQSVIKNTNIRIGRIDMFNLTDFKETEIELLKRYLKKNHAFRLREFKPKMRALLDDGFRLYNNEAFASNGWMAFSSLLGTNNIDTLSYRYDLRNSDYLWSYGCNAGAYTNIYNIAYSDEMAKFEYGSIFTILLGSYAGDWDTQNNILRSTTASSPSILAAMWSGRPFWFFHHMALGEPIGYSAMISENNRDTYQAAGDKARKGIHIELLGDPTLRMTYPAPPVDFSLASDTTIGKQRIINLQWENPDDDILGYFLFRADSLTGKFKKIRKEIINSTHYRDTLYTTNDIVYMLRSVKHERAVSGSFYNLSQGVFAEVKNVSNIAETKNFQRITIYPNPATNIININLPFPNNVKFIYQITDICGKVIMQSQPHVTNSDNMILQINLSKKIQEIESTVYFIRILANNNIYFGKLLIIN